MSSTKQMNPLLSRYLQSLASRPLLTKAITASVLSFLQEIIAGRIAGAKPAPFKRTGILPLDMIKSNSRALKMASYGFFISAPLGHSLLSILQSIFAGSTSAKAKLGQIVAANLFVSPIQQSVYLFCMAYINGAQSIDQASKFVKLGFWKIMKMTWVVSPISMAIAQKYLDPPLWVPFFNLIAFVFGTYINVVTKRKAAHLARLAAKQKKDQE